MTWSNQPSMGARVSRKSVNGTAWGYHDFDVTSLVRAWVNGSQPNHGIVLRSLESSGNDTASLYFVTRDYSDASRHPYLEITYAGQANTETQAAPASPSTHQGARLHDVLASDVTRLPKPENGKSQGFDTTWP